MWVATPMSAHELSSSRLPTYYSAALCDYKGLRRAGRACGLLRLGRKQAQWQQAASVLQPSTTQ